MHGSITGTQTKKKLFRNFRRKPKRYYWNIGVQILYCYRTMYWYRKISYHYRLIVILIKSVWIRNIFLVSLSLEYIDLHRLNFRLIRKRRRNKSAKGENLTSKINEKKRKDRRRSYKEKNREGSNKTLEVQESEFFCAYQGLQGRVKVLC